MSEQLATDDRQQAGNPACPTLAIGSVSDIPLVYEASHVCCLDHAVSAQVAICQSMHESIGQ